MKKDKRMFDGNYHCAYCGKVFRIAYQAEFIEHQENCVMKPAPDKMVAIERILLRDNPNFNYLGRAVKSILSLSPEPVLPMIQKYIDDNNIYRVEFGHYEDARWIPLKTHRVNIMEVLNGEK